jgi:hypothetical protein
MSRRSLPVFFALRQATAARFLGNARAQWPSATMSRTPSAAIPTAPRSS